MNGLVGIGKDKEGRIKGEEVLYFPTGWSIPSIRGGGGNQGRTGKTGNC